MFEAFARDERGIEGLPVRLVIAFIVGLASLSVMLNMVSGLGGFAVSELDARPDPDVLSTRERDVSVTVVDASGEPVAGATVVVRSGTATIDGPKTAETGADGTTAVRLDPHLATNQREGTVDIDVKPPAGSRFVDERENTELLVLRR